jgi:CRP-like cAMP-binding protein
VRERIVDQLEELATAMRAARDQEVTVPLSQSELAGLVGATRETTSSTLNILQREGFVALGHRIVTVLPTVGHRAATRGAVTAIGMSAGGN